jgi:undecaprenyl-phosphate galactose phosphotransferase
MRSSYTSHTAGGSFLPAVIFALFDYLSLVVAGLFAVHLRNWIMTYSSFHLSAAYFFFWLPLVFMLFLFFEGLYGKRMLVYQMTERIFLSCLGGTVFSVLLMFIAQVSGQVSRLFVLLFAALAFAILSIVRIFICKVFKKVRAFQIPVLIVGAGKTADFVVRQIRRDAGMRYRILGFLEDRKPFKDYGPNMPILGGFDDLEKAAKETGVDTILIAAPGLPQDKLSDLIYRAQSLVKHVAVVPNLVAVPMSNVSVESFFDAKIMVLHIKNNLDNPWNRLLKRLFDIGATIVGGILISPLLLAIAIWVYHDSPGPVIFKHRRVGKDGREFNCYKFRSMCVNSKEVLDHLLATDPKAKAEWDKEFKLKDDPRITKSGAFLRKTSLDELPQLWNVLKGEMSLVGPRPIVQAEVERYDKFIKEYYSVLPGITGMWQTSGRSDIDYPERVQMDSWYVHNWSVWLDMVLLWRTVAVVLSHKGAY